MRGLLFLAVTAPLAGQITFNRHVAPLLFEYCAPCHRPGEAAPFPLPTYRDARQHAQQIVKATRSRYMPPWLPEPGYGEFAGARRLGDDQVRLLEQWVEQGAAEGPATDLPPAPRFTEGWQLGTPDLVVRMPRPYLLAAQGGDVFRNFVAPVPLTETRYVRAVEIRPGNKRVVHHANILIDRKQSSRRRDEQDGEVGFAGMNVILESDTFDPESHFLFWKPGTPPEVEPEDMAWRLDPGTDLVLNMHLQPSGKLEPIQAAIGLYFTHRAPDRLPMLLQLDNDGALDIPPGKRDFLAADDFRLPLDVEVLGVYPHAHYIGKQMEGFATLPDGSKRWLIRIRDWDINWQAVYRYTKPVSLPKGTVLSMRWWYDNSAANPRNPSRPPRRVRAGDRSADEMAHFWIQVVPRGKGDGRMVLQEALTRHKLRKYPRDVALHYNLGAVLLSLGKTEEAVGRLREALGIAPDHAAARNSLGAALESQGKLEEAIAEYQRAVRQDPDYADAHYNLGNSLAAQGRFEEAAGHYREVLRLHPGDTPARKRLAQVLQASGGGLASRNQWSEAVTRYREAVALDPEDADGHNNLGAALARVGNKGEAIACFEQALRLQPGHEAARRNLGLARR
ncbi:MAG: tetratricopeptide repeat protein [Acidobacteria bacterium]|nr:tetratricopeptide repeat protein [Acidobacteriota bacterium]